MSLLVSSIDVPAPCRRRSKRTRRAALATTLVLICALLAACDGHGVISIDDGIPGAQADGNSSNSALDRTGERIAFESSATNLVANDTNSASDIFVTDRTTGETERVSVASDGQQANGPSELPDISANGRIVAFESTATNLVPNDTNGVRDVFVRDLDTGTTVRASVADGGGQGTGDSEGAAISANGRYVAFYSNASNLVANDTNHAADIFVRDLVNGTTERVSVANDESQADSTSVTPTISDDGQVVAFTSSASNLVPGDVNLSTDVFVRDIAAGTTISVTSVPLGQYSATADPNISGNGRYVAFVSDGDNIVPNDTNNSSDVFVFDRDTGTTTRVSVASDGTEGNAGGFDAHLSSNGRYVSFSSWSDNLAPNDANGPYGADVFVRDNVTGQTSRVSESSSGMSGNADSHESDISRDGHVVAFSSDATNLVSGDENGFADIYYKLLP